MTNKRLTLVAAILGSGVVFVDSTVVNVALPTIRDDLGSGLSGQQWVVDAYLLTLSSLLLIGGSLGDLFGQRRMFAFGVASFGVASLACAAAPTIEFLIAGRALQGVAGALLIPSTLGLIVANFGPDQRGGAIGSWTAWTGISTVIGPLAGGLLLSAASWRWIFAINVIPVAFSLYFVMRIEERHTRPAGAHVDALGALLCAIGFGGTVFALIEQPHYGWSDATIALPLAGGIGALIAFVVHEHRTLDPMLSIELFRNRNFSIGNAATLLIYAGLGGIFFLLVLFLQQVAGYSALGAGASLLPITALIFVLSRRFGALADRYGPRFFMSVGPLLAAVGALLLLSVDADADYLREVLPAMIVFGLGLSLTVAPLTAAVLGAVDEHHAGIASGVNNAIARVASLLAVAAVGAVLASQFEAEVDKHLSRPGLGASARTALEGAQPLSTEGAVARSPQTREIAEDASVSAFDLTIGLNAALLALGGLICALGIENPRRRVAAEECPGGQICGASADVAPRPAEAEPVPA